MLKLMLAAMHCGGPMLSRPNAKPVADANRLPTFVTLIIAEGLMTLKIIRRRKSHGIILTTTIVALGANSRSRAEAGRSH
jgi:hypothetical protein